ncbi:MAG TPA: hypothetical protein VM935_20575 [Chitinophagaceae bacterium]|jgi:hypothetical protein|nr:hypothetical protein [Chitinophagaceae bacterium]
MLNIEITKGNEDGTLELEVNGNHSNGNEKAKKGSPVNWKVKPNSNVKHIHAITMKTGNFNPPNTNIFSNDPPTPQGGGKSKHWKGSINAGAADGAEFSYDIHWVPEGSADVKIFDPKISVLPDF